MVEISDLTGFIYPEHVTTGLAVSSVPVLVGKVWLQKRDPDTKYSSSLCFGFMQTHKNILFCFLFFTRDRSS